VNIPLFVTASGILVVFSAGFVWTFWKLSATYERRYVREWTRTWIALGVYALAAGLALLSVNVAPLSGARMFFSVASVTAGLWHLRSLLSGMHELCAPGQRRPVRREAFITVAVVIALALVLVPTEPRSERALALYLTRLMLLAAAWGVAYASAGLQILRTQPGASDIARRTLAVGLIGYAVLRVAEPLMHFLGPSPILAQFLTFGGLPLLVAVGAGMLITLLEVERTNALREAEARTEAEQSANASEAALSTALATSSDPVFIVNRDAVLVSANRTFLDLASLGTGVSVRPGAAIVPLMDERTRLFWEEAFPRALGGESLSRQTSFVFTRGEDARRFVVRFSPVRERGSIIGVLVVSHDMTEEERLRTELERREEWFRLLIENASDMIFQVSGDVQIEYASPSVTRILGYDHLDLVGRSGLDFIHPEDAPTVADALRRSLAQDETVPTVVPLRARNSVGEYIPLEGVSRPYAESDGTERLIVALRDVRERRRLEDELVAARRLEAIGRLAGGVAHDFNNLLTAVSGNVQLLRERAEDDSGFAGHLDEIDQSVHRGAELTRRLLAFARQQLIEPRILRVPIVVQDLELLLRRLLGDSVFLDVDVPMAVWSVRADPTAFEQIIVNLAVNARDAMPQGGSLRISASNFVVGPSGHESLDLTNGEWVRLDVSDTGVGIPDDVLGRIFEPFFTTKQGSGGTGLGLATVYGAATQMGGAVRVSSEVGRGTTFSVFLPRVIAPDDASPHPARSPLPKAKPGEVIILMEDEAPVREVTAKLLRKLGYEVLTAPDGETGVALSATRRERVDIVVSDIVMPGIHGDVAAERIRAQRPGTPVLFISGFSQEALRWTSGMPAGSRLLPKPFSLEDLARSIRDLLDGPRS
jgi:PAS domain S-box-containing protein